MVAALEEDKEFAKKLENASIDHIKSGAIADELHFVDHNVRSKLDELKRIEMERLRKLTVKEKHLKEQIEREGSQSGGEDSDRKWRTVGNSGSSASSGISAGTLTLRSIIFSHSVACFLTLSSLDVNVNLHSVESCHCMSH